MPLLIHCSLYSGPQYAIVENDKLTLRNLSTQKVGNIKFSDPRHPIAFFPAKSPYERVVKENYNRYV